MKYIILLLAISLSFSLYGQERTVSKSMGNNDTYYKYTGTAADTLTSTNQDTIDFVVQYRGEGYVRKIAVKSRFDVVLGADTTVSVSVYGKEFYDDTDYVQVIAATTSDAVLVDNVFQVLTSDWTETTAAYNSTAAAHNNVGVAFDVPFTNPTAGTTDTLEYPAVTFAEAEYVLANAAQTVTPLDKSYRYYRIRYIIQGDDSVGTGIKIDEIEFKLYVD